MSAFKAYRRRQKGNGTALRLMNMSAFATALPIRFHVKHRVPSAHSSRLQRIVIELNRLAGYVHPENVFITSTRTLYVPRETPVQTRMLAQFKPRQDAGNTRVSDREEMPYMGMSNPPRQSRHPLSRFPRTWSQMFHVKHETATFLELKPAPLLHP